MFRRRNGFTSIPETALDRYNALPLTYRATMISLHRYVWAKPHEVHVLCPAGQLISLTVPAHSTGWNARQFSRLEYLPVEAVRSAVKRLERDGLITLTRCTYCSKCDKQCQARTVFGESRTVSGPKQNSLQNSFLELLTVMPDKQIQAPSKIQNSFQNSLPPVPEQFIPPPRTVSVLEPVGPQEPAKPLSRTIPYYEREKKREPTLGDPRPGLGGKEPTGKETTDDNPATPRPQGGPLENTPPSKAATLSRTIERRRSAWIQSLMKAGKAHNTVISQPNLSTWAAVLESTGQAMLTAWNTDVAGAVRGLDDLVKRLTVDDHSLARYLNAPRFLLQDWPKLVDPAPAVMEWTADDERKAREAVRAQRARSERIAALARAESTGTAVEPATAEEVSNV